MDGVGCGRRAVVPLCFNERVIYQQGRALERDSLRGVIGECPSVHGSEQIPGLWVSYCRLRNINCNRAVRIEVTRGQGRPNRRFDGNTDQADDGRDGTGHHLSVIKGGV